MPAKPKRPFTLQWIADLLMEDAGCLQKSMFGCQVVYRRGRLVIGLSDRREPWNGVLVPTEHQHHASLQSQFPLLQPHSVLPKWLYLSQSEDSFEEVALKLAEAIQSGDLRLGVEPKPKSRKRGQPA